MSFALIPSLLGALLCLSFQLEAQATVDTLTYFPSDRIRGGAPAFYQVISDYITYPAAARQRKIVGTTIAVIRVSPEGRLADVGIINSLHRTVDQAVRRTLRRTQSQWLADQFIEEDIAFFVPITFLPTGPQLLQDRDQPAFLLPTVNVVIDDELSTSVTDDTAIVRQANRWYREKNYALALKHLDELIRRNPYPRELYLMRGNAYYQLGNHERGCADFAMIRSFLKQPVPTAAATLCLQ